MPETLPTHSPLGASSAERWLACPGSVALIKALDLPPSDEPDYRREGTAAHEAIAHCLKEGLDAWEVVGQKFYNTEVDVEIADAIQVYLDTVRPLMVEHATVLIEHKISSPDSVYFYGTVDCATIADSLLTVSDYKHGVGVQVDVEWNAQLMYYAYGILMEHLDVRRVVLRIVQPRMIGREPVQRWECAAEDIIEWAQKKLIPAMELTAIDDTLVPGDHCRFCPAKLVCPVLKATFRACTLADPKSVVALNDQELVLEYPMMTLVKMYIKALEEETLRRLVAGGLQNNGVLKLVNKKANRVWKAEAKALFMERFGDKVWNPAEFKSPAEMEKIDGTAKKLVHEYAYTPQSGYTVALMDDKRPAVTIQTATEAFSGVLDTAVLVE